MTPSTARDAGGQVTAPPERRVEFDPDGDHSRLRIDGMDGRSADWERLAEHMRGAGPFARETYRRLMGSILAADHHNTLARLLDEEREAAAQLDGAINAATQCWCALHNATAWLARLLLYVEAVDGARIAAERWRAAAEAINDYQPYGVQRGVDPYSLCQPPTLVPEPLRLTASVTPGAAEAITKHEQATAKREQWLRQMRELAPAVPIPDLTLSSPSRRKAEES